MSSAGSRDVNIPNGEVTMFTDRLFNRHPDVMLEKMMDRSALGQRVISSNVANVSTPGYQRRGVVFDEVLHEMVQMQKVMNTTDERHMPSPTRIENLEPEVALVENGYWNGINNVNMDEEMVDLAKNQLDFEMAARLYNLRITQLRTAIRGRR